jgi:hypothetical protein
MTVRRIINGQKRQTTPPSLTKEENNIDENNLLDVNKVIKNKSTKIMDTNTYNRICFVISLFNKLIPSSTNKDYLDFATGYKIIKMRSNIKDPFEAPRLTTY